MQEKKDTCHNPSHHFGDCPSPNLGPARVITLEIKCKCGYSGQVQTRLSPLISHNCWLTEPAVQQLIDQLDNTHVETSICSSCTGYQAKYRSKQ